MFLGIVSVASKNLFLAVLAGLSQLLQAHMAFRGTMKPPEDGSQSDFQKIMGMQLKYVFPLLIGTISYTTSAAIALYFISTNIAGSLQEWYVRHSLNTENRSQTSIVVEG